MLHSWHEENKLPFPLVGVLAGNRKGMAAFAKVKRRIPDWGIKRRLESRFRINPFFLWEKASNPLFSRIRSNKTQMFS